MWQCFPLDFVVVRDVGDFILQKFLRSRTHCDGCLPLRLTLKIPTYLVMVCIQLGFLCSLINVPLKNDCLSNWRRIRWYLKMGFSFSHLVNRFSPLSFSVWNGKFVGFTGLILSWYNSVQLHGSERSEPYACSVASMPTKTSLSMGIFRFRDQCFQRALRYERPTYSNEGTGELQL